VCSNELTIIGESCTYGGSGNWAVTGSDTCTLTTATDLHGKNLTFTGTGLITITAALYNWTSCRAENGATVRVQAGGKLSRYS